MFAKLSALAVLVPFAAALTINAPTNAVSSGSVNLSWSTVASDQVFSIELHHPSFNNDLAIANNVDPATGGLTITLPSVPAQDGYTLRAVNISNINEAYSTSGDFAIGAPASSSASSTGSGSASASGTGAGASHSGTGTGAAGTSSTGAITAGGQTTSGFGVTKSASNTASAPSGSNTAPSGSNTASASASGSAGKNAAAATTFSSAAGLLGAVAAVAVFAL